MWRCCASPSAASARAPVGSSEGASDGRGTAAGAWVDIPPYQGDILVRGSESLGKTKDGHLARAVL